MNMSDFEKFKEEFPWWIFEIGKCYDRFSSFMKYWSSEILKIDGRFISNEKSDYSEKSTSDNEGFCSTIFQPFQFELKQKKACGNESHKK